MRLLNKKQINALSASERLSYLGTVLPVCLDLIGEGRVFEYPNANRCKKWAIKITHDAYELNPGLREERSLERYFVAKAGRKLKLQSHALSRFIEDAYSSGRAKDLIPEEIKALPSTQK